MQKEFIRDKLVMAVINPSSLIPLNESEFRRTVIGNAVKVLNLKAARAACRVSKSRFARLIIGTVNIRDACSEYFETIRNRVERVRLAVSR